MSTPQNPGDGDTPQDPSDPQNPYGTPPPPPPPPSDPGAPTTPPPSSPPPDTTPPTTQIPAAPAPGGDPATPPGAPAAPPPYGEQPPPSAIPPAAPAYGQPAQPAYAQPGQPAYAAPAYGSSPMPGPAEPGKGMAITALVLSILGCTCIALLVAVPLAIVALVRSRGGANRGKGMAIAALVISFLYVIAWAIGGYYIYDYAKDFKDVDGLKAGNCITAKGLTDESDTGVTQIRSVSCSDKHDGEVLATASLSADEASTYSDTDPVTVCTPSVTAAGSADLLANADLVLIALTQDEKPSKGDKLVCVIANADGSDLTSKLGS
jgi:uncharacterized protein DUF4190